MGRLSEWPMAAKAALAVLALVILAALWSVLASTTFLVATGLLARDTLPFVQWWQYLGQYGWDHQTAGPWLKLSAGVATVIPLAVSFLAVAALFQIVDGAQAVAAGMLRGLGDTAVPMIYAVFGYWVVAIGVGVALAFGAGWGGVGIWVGLASGLAVVSVLMVARWMRRERLGLQRLVARP